MELKIFRDAMPTAGTDCTVRAELPLETEILISDYLPPVFKLVKCFVRPVVLQKQLQPGRLTLEGYLRCTVYYQGEENAGLCQTEQKLPFTKALELPEFPFSAWTAVVEGQTEYINCRAVNPRRIELRGAYGLVAAVHTQNKAEVITALSEAGIEQKLCTIRGVRRAVVLDKLVTAEGEITFPGTPTAILDLSGRAEIRELKILHGKAVAKGRVCLLCAWRAEGEPTLQDLSSELSFQQVLDTDGLSEDCRCLCMAEPVGITATPREGDTPGTVTVTLMLRFRAWRPYQLQCVADAFSTRFGTDITPQTLPAETLVCFLNETADVTGAGPLPDAGAKILACFAAFGPAQITQSGSGFALMARTVVTVFAENSLGEFESYEKTLEFSLPLTPAEPLPQDAELYPECWLTAEDLQCSSEGGTLKVSLTVRAEGAVLCRNEYTGVGSIALGEELAPADPEISLRICYAQAGEELFEIAKRFHVSPGQMLAANGLEEGTACLPQAQRLLVPGNGI